MLPSKTLFGAGVAGNNVVVDTPVASIINLTPGRYKIWGNGRHTLADGLKMTSPQILTFPSGPNSDFSFGPFLVDVLSSAIGIGVSLAVATGAADTASVIIYAEKITGH